MNINTPEEYLRYQKCLEELIWEYGAEVQDPHLLIRALVFEITQLKYNERAMAADIYSLEFRIRQLENP
jgi:hypothetical protein